MAAAPHRAVQNQAFCRTGRPRWTVRYRKRPCSVREAHLSAGAARGLLLNTKASQEAACSRAPAAIVPGPEPESRDAGVSLLAKNGSHPAEVDAAESPAGQVSESGMSGNAGIGSHLAATDAAESPAGWVDGPGDSGFPEIGSHPAAADFSDEPEAVLWRRPHIAPYRIRPSVVRDGLAGQCGTENGHVVYARLISAPGPHAAVAAAQVRRKAGRSVAGGCGTGRPVADKYLIMSRIMICPVWFCRQVKCSFA